VLQPASDRTVLILVIDDNPDDRLLAARELRRGFPGAVILEVESGEEFAGTIAGRRPDLVVTDYRMGWMDGLDVLRLVKELDPDIPVVMLTGTGGEDIAVAAMRSGVDDYLLKRGHEYARLPVAAQAALDRARARREARRAQERYRNLFRHVPVGLALCSAEGEVLEANGALLGMLGIPAGGEAAPARTQLTEALLGEHRAAWDAAKAGTAVEATCRRLDGGTMAVVIRARAVEGEHGVALYECAVTDITEVRKAQGERTVLLAELYHRVNNNLQLLISFVLTLANRTPDPEMRRSLEDLSARIHSIALVQGRLYKSGDYARVNIREFLDELLASLLQGTRIRLVAELDDVVVPVSTAVPVGLMANEVLLNALKHAFDEVAAPELRVRLKGSGGEAGAQATLVIEDNGVGMAPEAAARPSSRGGYGTRLLRSLSRQAGGQVGTQSEPGGGTRVTISFPER
jgi:PAS domain S-box-containing protein